MCNTLRQLVGAAPLCGDTPRPELTLLAFAALVAPLIVATACSDGSGVGFAPNQNGASAPSLLDSSDPQLPDPQLSDPQPAGAGSPGAGSSQGPSGSGALPASSASEPPPGGSTSPPQGESPGAVPASSSGEPQPSATETNFFGAGCRKDADCGENRRCEFPEGAPAPVAESDAGAGEGADAAAPPVTVGHCVAL